MAVLIGNLRYVLLLPALLLWPWTGANGAQTASPAPPSAVRVTRSETLLAKLMGIDVSGKDAQDTVSASVAISPDGRRSAYVRQQPDGKEAVVTDGVLGKSYAMILPFSLRFSPDSRHLAYVAIPEIVKVPTGKRNLFGRQPTQNAFVQCFAVLDGQEQKPYKYIDTVGLIFSPDSRQLTYVARIMTRLGTLEDIAVIGETEVAGEFDQVGAWDGIEAITFSPDGKHHAFTALRDRKWYVYADGTLHAGPYDGIITDTLRFSPDSQHLAFGAISDGSFHLIRDGHEQGEFTLLPRSLCFSPDSRHVAFAAVQRSRSGNKKNTTVVLMQDSVESAGAAYTFLGEITFSPDGKHIAYAAIPAETRKAMVVRDGKDGTSFDALHYGMTFSPDGQHLAYIGERDGRHRVVLDGVGSPQFDDIPGPLVFSPDGQHLAYWAQTGRNRFALIVDGVEQARMQQWVPVFTQERRAVPVLSFQDERTLFGAGLRDGALYRVQITLPPFATETGEPRSSEEAKPQFLPAQQR